MNRDDIAQMMQDTAGANWGTEAHFQKFAALVAAKVNGTYSPIGTVAGGATERTFMHPSVKYVLPTGLQLYARIEVREEDKI